MSFNKNGKFEGPENFISEKKKSFRINNEIMKEDKMFTLLQRINYTKYGLQYIDFNEVVEVIRNGDLVLYDSEYGKYTLRQAIEHIRTVPEEDRQYWKSRLLPAVAYNARFLEVNSKGLDDYSCITAMDFDHIATRDEMIHLRNRLIITPCVVCVFVTPSGEGLKALVLHDNENPDLHRDLYEQLLKKFDVASKDESCKDIARRNYLSYDPDIWVNRSPVAFHYIPTIKPQNYSKQYSGNSVKSVSDESIIRIMDSVWKKKHPEYWLEGQRANSIFKLACLMCKWGVDEDFAIEYFVDGWEDRTMSEDEIVSHVRNAYKAESDNFEILQFRIY
ncbi:VirE N-terminal domain protein [Phocaeicola coprocola DSM 17136]|uniref:VirE N-terminal domain protein n=2 Tax=Phocaeicola coprocola TaxID=310298 RepID=B3JNL9_9BACT|nr:VirE N-terminal domain protein [Phocaeicola coprocola DSM 17136]